MDEVLQRILEIGRSGNYPQIATIPSLQDHRSVVRLADVYRDKIKDFAKELSNDDLIAFLKCIAMVEHKVGTMGSVTLLQLLFPLVRDPDYKILDWVLRNTESYWYYAHGARSIEELHVIRKMRAEITAANMKRDSERQIRDKKRLAEKATGNLYNAVRRKDIKAIRALICKGADVNVSTPDGMPIIDYAVSHGLEEIVAELRSFVIT